MADQSKKDALDRAALAYIQLGNLVRRTRSDEKSEAVALVLAEAIPVEDKIRRIERIDASTPPFDGRKVPARPAAPPAQPPSQPQAPTHLAEPAAASLSSGKQSLVLAAKNRARLRAELPPGTFMRYLFMEGSEMRSKAKGNRFLKAGLLSPSFDREAARAFLEGFKRDASPVLLSALEASLHDGWRFLRKSEYNRLAALKRLVSEVGSIAPPKLSSEDPLSLRRFFRLELAFLALRADPASLAEIVASFENALSKMAYPRNLTDEARSSARRLLQDGGRPPCLQDLILAVNMVRLRRLIRIRDLLKYANEPLFSLTDFDCGDEVQGAIDARIAELRERLEVLAKENEETLRLKAFVRRDGEGNIDFDPLALLYESDKERKRSWEKDENNVMLLVAGLAERFLQMMTDIQARTSDQALEYEASRLRSAASKLERIRFYLPNLPWSRFVAIKSRSAQATKYEAESMGLVSEAADLFYRCGSRLVELLRSREGLAANSREGMPVLPVEGGEVSLEDMALRQALEAAVSAAYLAALRFQEPTIGAVLKNERQAGDQRQAVLDEIERLADAETFKEARAKLGLA